MTSFLADENVSRLVIDRISAAGLDIISVATTRSGASDNDVLALATSERRILITEDRDFGELVVRQRFPVPGVVLLELDRMSNASEAQSVVAVLTANLNRLSGSLTVIEPGRVRIRPLPRPGNRRRAAHPSGDGDVQLLSSRSSAPTC